MTDSKEDAYFDPLPTLSLRQASFLDKLEQGYNLSVTAYPGCGKSTFISHIAAAFPDKNLLVISYNTALVKATRSLLRRVIQRQAPNAGWILCKTYHGLLTSLSGKTIKDDVLFMRALKSTPFAILAQFWKYRNIDMLIIDECQDKKRAYFLLVCITALVMCSNPSQLQWCVLGDEDQLLYNFYPINKADARYLTCADRIFTSVITPRTWFRGELDESYRATPQIAAFLNALAPERHMVSAKTSRITDWVTLYLADPYVDAAAIIYNIVKEERREHKLHDILILCSALNQRSPARRIVDLLVANGVPVHMERSGALAVSESTPDNNDTMREDEKDTSKNKVTLRTICSAKGLQAEIVIAVNLGTLFDGNLTTQQTVAMSRANTRLYVIQNAFYTNYQDLNIVLSKLTQRHLRVKELRPVADAPKVRDEDKSASSFASKGALDIHSLFAFLDVDHLDDLLKHISFEPLVAGIQETDDSDGGSGNSNPITNDDNDQEEETAHAAYARAVTQSFDNNETHINLISICSLALQLALETWMTGITPSSVANVLSKIQSNTDPKYAIMQNLIYDALDVIGKELASSEITQEDAESADSPLVNRQDTIWNVMASFAKLAIAMDAYDGYRERLHFVNSFDFILSPFVKRRWEALCENLQFLLQDCEKLVWQTEVVGRFTHDGEPLQLIACPAIVNSDHTHLVHFSRHSIISYEDRLMAIAEALVINQESDVKDMRIYVVNLVDTSVEEVKLCTNATQTVVPAGSVTELPRRCPCDFLAAAVRFKITSSAIERDEKETDVATKEDDDATFIARAQQDIQDIIDTYLSSSSDQVVTDE